MEGQEIQIRAHTNHDGIVHLDIPTGIADRDIRITISFITTDEEAGQEKALPPRVPGIDEGRFVVPDDFDDPLPPEIIKAFEGGE